MGNRAGCRSFGGVVDRLNVLGVIQHHIQLDVFTPTILEFKVILCYTGSSLSEKILKGHLPEEWAIGN